MFKNREFICANFMIQSHVRDEIRGILFLQQRDSVTFRSSRAILSHVSNQVSVIARMM